MAFELKIQPPVVSQAAGLAKRNVNAGAKQIGPFISAPSFLPLHFCQFISANSFLPIHFCQFIPANSFQPIRGREHAEIRPAKRVSNNDHWLSPNNNLCKTRISTYGWNAHKV